MGKNKNHSYKVLQLITSYVLLLDGLLKSIIGLTLSSLLCCFFHTNCVLHTFLFSFQVFKGFKPLIERRRRLNVDRHSVFRGDHIPGARQVHKNRAQVRQRRYDAHVQPVGDGRGVTERANPQAVAHGVPDVMRGHGDEKHPRQGAPRVLEAADPHEEAKCEADDGDEGGTVEGRTMRQ